MCTNYLPENPIAFCRSVIYDQEGCGICQKQGYDVMWSSPFSRFAHSVCYKKIEYCEKDLISEINRLFKVKKDRFTAHEAAVKAVQSQLGKEVSLLFYLDSKGSEELKKLFNTLGINALREYLLSVIENLEKV